MEEGSAAGWKGKGEGRKRRSRPRTMPCLFVYLSFAHSCIKYVYVYVGREARASPRALAMDGCGVMMDA